MPARGVSLLVVCTSICFAGLNFSQAQEATSANLPDQFQTGEMIQVQKPKKKKRDSSSKKVAAAAAESTAPVPEQMPTSEEMPPQSAPAEEKKIEPHPNTGSMPPAQKPETSIEQASAAQERPVAVHHEKKIRSRKRPRPAPVVQPEAPSIAAPVAMSLSVAQSLATTAPLPEYTYEMKRRNLSGSGTCVVTVDTATGTVADAVMSQSTGNALLDKLTVQTFKSWRFKPGSVSQVRIPISYE
jgi:TonB family protein